MLTLSEGVPLVLKASGIIQIVEANVAAMPPKAERTAADYGKALGAAPDGPLMQVLELFDDVEAAIKS